MIIILYLEYNIMTNSKPFIVSIEGNIGSGKSTLIDMMDAAWGGKDSKFVFLREPVDVWENVKDGRDDENILQKFYQDSNKYAFSFQIMAYMTFYQQLTKAISENDENTIIICERSMDSSKAIFAKMLYDYGNMDDVEYQVLEMFYNQMERIQLDAIVYLDVDIETCDQRIKSRSRIGEHDIKIDYLEKCARYHEEWIQNSNFVFNDNKFIRINGNTKMKCILTSVRDFLKTIKKVQRTAFMRTPLMIETSANTKTYLTTCEICKNKISKEYYYYLTHLKKDNINMCNICSDILIKPFCDDGWKFIRFYSAF